jgi:phospholipid-binding lipoprotein MlaA
VDKRHRIPFRYRQSGSPFEYELLRMLYTMKRDYDTEN